MPTGPSNQYASSRTESEFGNPEFSPVPNSAYAAPEQLGPYAAPATPYSPTLAYRFDGTPDPYRDQREPVPQGIRQPARGVRAWWARLTAERQSRESVQSFSAQEKELTEDAGRSGLRWKLRPGILAAPNARASQEMNPATGGLVTRPMTGGTPKRFNGVHISMADHRRYNNEIYGMAPARRARTTYRLDLASWGEDTVDIQTPQDYVANQTLIQPDIGVAPNAAYRL